MCSLNPCRLGVRPSWRNGPFECAAAHMGVRFADNPRMSRLLVIALLLAQAGCAMPPAPAGLQAASPCQADETSYACQVDRYNKVNN